MDQTSLLIRENPHALGNFWDTKELFVCPASPWSDLVTERHHPMLPSFSLEGCSELSPCLCVKLPPPVHTQTPHIWLGPLPLDPS